MAWQPVLEGALRDRALEAAAAIGEALLALPQVDLGSGLARGDAGLALTHALLDQTFPHVGHAEQAAARLERAAERMITGDVGLWEGSHGAAWAISQLVATDGEADPCADFDRGTLALVARSPWEGLYDLIHGLVGMGVYALERLPRATAGRILEEVVARLAELAEHEAAGTTWLTRPETVDASIARVYPRGWYELGLAHGVAGPIVLLSATARAGIAPERCRTLVQGAVRWLLALHAPGGRPSRFPRLLEADGRRPRPAYAAAWCSGDPGLAVALISAAQSFDRPDWLALGLEVARGAAARSPEDAAIADACLCHGAVGLAHLCNRLWQATGDDELRQRAVTWFERGLGLREDGAAGVAGFRSRSHPEHGREPGVLMGAAGVALGLLAATAGDPPSWDRLMLLLP